MADYPFPGRLNRHVVRAAAALLCSLFLCEAAFCGTSTDVSEGTLSESAFHMEDQRCRTTYEIFVYSFCDSDSDGTGDLGGVRNKLDYIQDLGFDQIWLMPVCPSPTYHKYDVTDYMAIDPAYGTLEDFEALISDCHERGIRVITDLVLNHTSSQHPWFLEAAEYLKSLPDGAAADASACPTLDYYHFTQTPESGYAQIPESSWYYEARFWEGMPDLNLDSEAVRDEIRKILSFWLEEGVDGFRLDAVTYYYTGNDEQNIRFLNWVKDTVDESAADLADAGGSFSPYIVCEAWIDQSLYAAYYASGVDSMFDFAYAGAEGLLAKTVKGQVSAQKFTDSLKAEQELFASFSDSYVNAPFYTNHDLDRSAGYYAYDDGSRTKFALGLNLMMSGNAFLYYGDEIGMKGSGKDENKRAPMMWVPEDTENPSAAGMCTGPEGMDSIKQKFPSAAEQENDPLSVLNYTKQAIAVRNKYNVIRDGIVIPIPELESDTVGAYRKIPGSPESGSDQESVEILFNTSEETQTVDLSSLSGPFLTLADCLCVSADPVLLDEGQLTLPPFSVAILKK